MNLADKLTASRLLMAPVFFAVYMGGISAGLSAGLVVALLWSLFVLIELSDLLDGMAARMMKTVSAFGKLFDPFADVFARLTYFVCFAYTGIMPLWIFLIIIYREFSQLFLRQLLADRGVAMGARPGGKTKAVFYMVAGAASLALWSFRALGAFAAADGVLATIVFVLYCVSALLSVASFVDYVVQFRKITAAQA
ncbi:MAG: CDP-diacylglycerol--glycerol-3-phosphate 3-phosphatidyltransferase [Spirochaetales bacterium]|nr:CDP-diacylglycerol--glycerol-3-phosphate 3-phosphatidyltransferase [Spirochaetales bacterium]